MRIVEAKFDNKTVVTYFDAETGMLSEQFDPSGVIILTDENVFRLHKDKLNKYKIITIPPGEANKTQKTADYIIERLLEMDADKSTLLAGVGGGVVTDLAGYVASVFKRGMRSALLPSTILAMTDAAIGGKNGVNVGRYKNMAGTTRQPEMLLYDYRFLKTLPREEWISGFAEIIKHACIKDAALFEELEKHDLDYYMQNDIALAALVEQNVAIKTAITVSDEFETGERYLLNFGHTFGHAIENLYGLPHGNAVSIGMVMAARISEEINNFDSAEVERLKKLLIQYELPVFIKADHAALMELLQKDKKRSGDAVNFVLLNKTGEGTVAKISLKNIQDLQNQVLS